VLVTQAFLATECSFEILADSDNMEQKRLAYKAFNETVVNHCSKRIHRRELYFHSDLLAMPVAIECLQTFTFLHASVIQKQ